MNKNELKEYMKAGTPQSMMRLSMNRTIKASIFFIGVIVIGAVGGFIIGIILGRELQGISMCIGALAGLAGAVGGVMNIPAFGGKAIQTKYEAPTTNAPADKQEEGK